ncbi:MAG: ABC transporter ATP-binding protein [Rhodobacter sp.]|nr:ABC transporter ATP-binding protein [Paracoccaceae bacterium]MCC0077341.1 ABC transporter ATP-binding protein [Rhodobacter sp.]
MADGDSEAFLSIREVSKTYRTLSKGTTVALTPSSFDIGAHEFVSIVGPSGCGKSTLLNILAGLLAPTTGEVVLESRPITGPDDRVGLVFQRPVLLPWRKVIDNVTLPIEVKKLRPKQAYVDKAYQLLEMVGLKGFENAYPSELSGGMQQRASIARTLVYDSRLLLMDEPFAALDAMTRDEMNVELLRIWRAQKMTIVFVTHNIPEAVMLSTKVIVMSARPGRVREIIPVELGERGLDLTGNPEFGRIVSHIRGLLDQPERGAQP